MAFEEKINIADLDIETKDLEQKQATLIVQIRELQKLQGDLKKSTDNLQTATNDQAKTYITQDAALKKLNTEYNRNKTVMAEAETGIKGLQAALDKENQSINATKKNNKELIRLRDQVNTKTKEGQKAVEQINKKLDDNTKFIKDNSSAQEKQRLNIGNYTTALDRVIPGLGTFTTLLHANSRAQAANSKGLKKLAIGLASTGIGAIVVAIGLLVAAFASTQKGIDVINEKLAPLKGSFQALIGVIQDLAINIVSQLQDRFTIAINSIALGINKIRVFWNAVTGDIDEANELIAEQEGLTAEIEKAQASLNKKTEDFSKIWEGAAKRIEAGAQAQREIERLTIAIQRLQIDSTVPLAKANNELKSYKQQAEDITQSEIERLEALEKAVEQQRFITKTKQDILDLQIEQTRLEQSQNDTNREAEQELQNLIAERYEVETAGIENLTTLQNLRNTIAQQVEAQALKKFQDRQKERLESQKEIDNLITQAQKVKFEEELFRLQEESTSRLALRMAELRLQEEFETRELQKKIANGEAFQRELTLLEKRFAAQRVNIKQEEERSKLALIAGVIDESGALLGEQTAAAKGLALAQNGINTYLAATAALAPPPTGAGPVLGPILAGVTIAQGLRNAGKIAGITLPKFGKGGLQEVGGKSHNSGGTKFFGEDGTAFEAEKGELIGVMNKKAAEVFMKYNSKLGNGSFAFNPFASGGAAYMFSDKGIVSAVNKNTEELRRKPTPQTIIHVEQGFAEINRKMYLS